MGLTGDVSYIDLGEKNEAREIESTGRWGKIKRYLKKFDGYLEKAGKYTLYFMPGILGGAGAVLNDPSVSALGLLALVGTVYTIVVGEVDE